MYVKFYFIQQISKIEDEIEKKVKKISYNYNLNYKKYKESFINDIDDINENNDEINKYNEYDEDIKYNKNNEDIKKITKSTSLNIKNNILYNDNIKRSKSLNSDIESNISNISNVSNVSTSSTSLTSLYDTSNTIIPPKIDDRSKEFNLNYPNLKKYTTLFNNKKKYIHITNYIVKIPILYELFKDYNDNKEHLKNYIKEILILFYTYPNIKLNITLED